MAQLYDTLWLHDIDNGAEEKTLALKTPLRFISYNNVQDAPTFQDTFNILLLGPKCIGKSTIVNLMFNQTIQSVTHNLSSESKETIILRGETVNGVKVGIIDTDGWNNNKAQDDVSLIMEGTQGINRIIVLLPQRLSNEDVLYINKYLEWLDYKKNCNLFHFWMTKCEAISNAEKMILNMQYTQKFNLQTPIQFIAVPNKRMVEGPNTKSMLKHAFSTVSIPFKCPNMDEFVHVAPFKSSDRSSCIIC